MHRKFSQEGLIEESKYEDVNSKNAFTSRVKKEL